VVLPIGGAGFTLFPRRRPYLARNTPMLEAFDLYAPGGRRLYHFEFHEEERLLAGEVRRSLDALAAAAPARVAKGGMTINNARHEAAVWLAIAEDQEERDRWLQARRGKAAQPSWPDPVHDWSLTNKLTELGARSGVSWTDKVTALRREITARRSSYPAQVDKGLLTSDAARARLERLEAVHDLYWRHGFAFDGTREELRELGDVVCAHNLMMEQRAA
jgi:hypothetical protein